MLIAGIDDHAVTEKHLVPFDCLSPFSQATTLEKLGVSTLICGGGAGIQAAQFVASKGAKAILTGNVGPNAVKTLAAAGVAVFVGQNGTVGEAIERYKKGDLQSTSTPNVTDHYGMGGAETGGGVSGGVGMAGGDRGMGGSGRGRGGCGRGMRAAVPPSNTSTSDGEEVSRLKDQVQQLQEQIKSIESKLMNSEA